MTAWVPPGYLPCMNDLCDATLMPMGRPHSHIKGDELWLVRLVLPPLVPHVRDQAEDAQPDVEGHEDEGTDLTSPHDQHS